MLPGHPDVESAKSIGGGDVMLRCAADPKEEDGVRDLIYDLFGKLWLQDGDVVVSCPEGNTQTPKNAPLSSETVTPLDSAHGLVVGSSAVTSVVTPTPPAPSSKREKSSGVVQKRADVAAEQMMESQGRHRGTKPTG
jgi:hypothetical protein